MGRPSAIKQARRHVERAAAHLADAASALRTLGCEQFARTIDSASFEAVCAFTGAEHHITTRREGGGDDL